MSDTTRLVNTDGAGIPAEPPPAPPGVVRVLDSSDADPTLLQFLRRRVRFSTAAILLVWLAMLGRDLATATDPVADTRKVMFAASAVVTAGLAAAAWARPWLTVPQYYALGWGAILTMIASAAVVQFDMLRRPDVTARLFSDGYRSALGVQFASGWGALWFSVVLGDVAYYPRTARWTLGFGTAIGGLAAGTCVAGYAANGTLDAGDLRTLLVPVLLWAALATSFGMMAQSRLESLERKAERARRFGQYRLIRRLAAGGMGELHLAEHLLLKRPSAIKMIRADKASDRTLLARFEREVRVLATLTHPNTVQVFDYGHTADGRFYYVMEYLPGLDLSRLVREYGPLPPGRVVHLLRQTCQALREAHDAGLIHRDVKPSNVMACRRGGVPDVAKLLDFGIVRAGDGPEPITGQGMLLGTPQYMSPEQAKGLSTDPRCDVYSLGATAYFLLTGRPVFARETPMMVVLAHIGEPPPSLGPSAPHDLAEVVMRCLAKSPDDRYPSVHCLEAAFAGCECAGDWTEIDAAKWWTEFDARTDAESRGRNAGTAGAAAKR